MTVMASDPHPATDALLERWIALLERCAATVDPEPYGRALLARWAEPHRRYHTTDHLLAVLDQVDALAEYADDPDAVRLAAWFHDAVYRPDRSENEERSAQLAIRALREAGLPATLIDQVVRLVRLTVSHFPHPGDRDGEVLCDADLAVLGRSPEAYAAYTAAVREEYAFIPEEVFRRERAVILHQLIALPVLYRTPAGHARFEQQARANLIAEINTLIA
ncbi:HD domain-containing protein [Kitasatospora kifunensis]